METMMLVALVLVQESQPRLPPVEQPPAADVDKALARGVGFLLADQNKNGSWGTPELNKAGIAIYAPVPGAHQAFQAAVTAMCVSALIETGGKSAEVQKAIERMRERKEIKAPKTPNADWGLIAPPTKAAES